MGQTLYEKYGGFATISKIVMDFYDRLLDSETVGDFFENTDMKRLIDHQSKFVAFLLGGPADYSGERLEQLHAHLKIGEADFDEMRQILAQTLADHEMTPEDCETVMAEIDARRHLIIAA